MRIVADEVRLRATSRSTTTGTTCDVEWRGERLTLRTPLAGRASGVESRVLARHARRRRRAFATALDGRGVSICATFDIPGRFQRRRASSSSTSRTIRPAPTCSRRRFAPSRRREPISVRALRASRQGLARDDSRAQRASRRASCSRWRRRRRRAARGTSTKRPRSRASWASRSTPSPISARRSTRAERERRHGARHRLVPHRRRRDGAVAGVAAGRVAFEDGPGRPPRLSRFLSRTVRRTRAHHGRVA